MHAMRATLGEGYRFTLVPTATMCGERSEPKPPVRALHLLRVKIRCTLVDPKKKSGLVRQGSVDPVAIIELCIGTYLRNKNKTSKYSIDARSPVVAPIF